MGDQSHALALKGGDDDSDGDSVERDVRVSKNLSFPAARDSAVHWSLRQQESPISARQKAYGDGDGVPHIGRGAVSSPCSTNGCGRTSEGTFPCTPPHPSTFAPPPSTFASSPSPPCSHLTRSAPGSHCELSDDGAGESLPAESESGGEGDAEPVLWVRPPRVRLAKAPVLGDGVRACTVVIECECA